MKEEPTDEELTKHDWIVYLMMIMAIILLLLINPVTL